jgi:hypothetical protein
MGIGKAAIRLPLEESARSFEGAVMQVRQTFSLYNLEFQRGEMPPMIGSY